MRVRASGFSLIELLTTAAIITLLLSFAIPSGARVRELSKRSTCAVNLAGIGASCTVYANENGGAWPVPPHNTHAYDNGGDGIDYANDDATIGPPRPNSDPGEIGFDRQRPTTWDLDGTDGSSIASVTRAFWMLVRRGDVAVEQFVCPSSGDTADPTELVELYYDFTGYRHISYGYRVPFGPPDTQPREGADNRIIFAADKSPYYLAAGNPTWHFLVAGPGDRPITVDDPPRSWRPFNSPNHGPRSHYFSQSLGRHSEGEGQNVLYAHGGVAFARKPTVGADHDNIYTVMQDDWNADGFGRIHGDSVHIHPQRNPYPGVEAFGAGDPNAYSTTDSLIYP